MIIEMPVSGILIGVKQALNNPFQPTFSVLKKLQFDYLATGLIYRSSNRPIGYSAMFL